MQTKKHDICNVEGISQNANTIQVNKWTGAWKFSAHKSVYTSRARGTTSPGSQ